MLNLSTEVCFLLALRILMISSISFGAIISFCQRQPLRSIAFQNICCLGIFPKDFAIWAWCCTFHPHIEIKIETFFLIIPSRNETHEICRYQKIFFSYYYLSWCVFWNVIKHQCNNPLQNKIKDQQVLKLTCNAFKNIHNPYSKE